MLKTKILTLFVLLFSLVSIEAAQITKKTYLYERPSTKKKYRIRLLRPGKNVEKIKKSRRGVFTKVDVGGDTGWVLTRKVGTYSGSSSSGSSSDSMSLTRSGLELELMVGFATNNFGLGAGVEVVYALPWAFSRSQRWDIGVGALYYPSAVFTTDLGSIGGVSVGEDDYELKFLAAGGFTRYLFRLFSDSFMIGPEIGFSHLRSEAEVILPGLTADVTITENQIFGGLKGIYRFGHNFQLGLGARFYAGDIATIFPHLSLGYHF